MPALVTLRGTFIANTSLFGTMAYLGGSLGEGLSVLPETMTKVRGARKKRLVKSSDELLKRPVTRNYLGTRSCELLAIVIGPPSF
jgi:hypothetical protein